MKSIVFATNNPHKMREVRQLLGDHYQFLSLAEIGCEEDIPETSPTIEGNALQKARYVYERYGYNCFAEDTGLEVRALDGAPGVYTARYAGPARDAMDNMQKLLRELRPHEDRTARFKTVIALIIDGQEYTFEGIVNGQIAPEMSGAEGFGYDPVFMPEAQTITFADMPAEAKNQISHRGRAIRKLQAFLLNET